MTIDDIKSFYTIPATAIPATTAPPTATEENQYSQNITSFVDEVRKNTPTIFAQPLLTCLHGNSQVCYFDYTFSVYFTKM